MIDLFLIGGFAVITLFFGWVGSTILEWAAKRGSRPVDPNEPKP
jgi:hypothetical protein